MDNVKLNREQLLAVVAFIESRGFHEPHVIVEILDHFACKVEEKMTRSPHISLESAIHSAHDDFGSLGFYPLRVAFEESATTRYTAIYRAACKKLLLNPLFLLVAGLSSFFYAKAAVWGVGKYEVAGFSINPAVAALLVAYIVVQLVLFQTVRKPFRRSPLMGIIRQLQTIPLAVLISMLCNAEPSSPRAFVFFAVIAGTTVAYLIMSTLATRSSSVEATGESTVVLDYIQQLSAS